MREGIESSNQATTGKNRERRGLHEEIVGPKDEGGRLEVWGARIGTKWQGVKCL